MTIIVRAGFGLNGKKQQTRYRKNNFPHREDSIFLRNPLPAREKASKSVSMLTKNGSARHGTRRFRPDASALQRSFYSIDRSIRPKPPHFSRQVPNRPGARSGAAAMMVSIRSAFSRALDHQRCRNRQKPPRDAACEMSDLASSVPNFRSASIEISEVQMIDASALACFDRPSYFNAGAEASFCANGATGEPGPIFCRLPVMT
jgi:hypothetical protein